MAHRSDGPASSLRMFGHVHRAMCSGGCQFEVLEEHVLSDSWSISACRYVKQVKEVRHRERRGAPENVDGATMESVGGEQCGAADEGRCCCWKAPLSVLSKELGVLPVRATSQPPGV